MFDPRWCYKPTHSWQHQRSSWYIYIFFVVFFFPPLRNSVLHSRSSAVGNCAEVNASGDATRRDVILQQQEPAERPPFTPAASLLPPANIHHVERPIRREAGGGNEPAARRQPKQRWQTWRFAGRRFAGRR